MPMKLIAMIVLSGMILLLFVFYLILFSMKSGKWFAEGRSGEYMPGGKRTYCLPVRTDDIPLADAHLEETLGRIYERLETYFKEMNPYLESNLSIDMVARHLYTNKVYLSKAVKRFSGLNFCQYVNRYRITYSIELFKKKPGLRMIELAQFSGFNSITSFNISFRAFMNDKPSDWFRRTKSRGSVETAKEAAL